MAKRANITAETLRQLIDLDEATGKLTWRERGPEWFDPGKQTAAHKAANWNAKFAGKPALDSLHPLGYRSGAALAVSLRSHIAVYAIYHGRMPRGPIDHINGVRDDNRPINLREVDHQGNAQNAKLYSSNKSGVPGVEWESCRHRWAVKININGRQRRLGRFREKGEAIAVRKAAEIKYGYHPNHGRVAS